MRRRNLFLAVMGMSLAASSAALPAASVVRAQLAERLPELRFQGTTLGDAIDFLRDVSQANIVVNWKALDTIGVSKDTPLNLHLADISLAKSLDLILDEASGGDSVTYYVDDGVIEITTRELADHNMVTRVYDVEDLIMEIPDFNNAPQFSLDASQNQSGSSSGGGSGGGGLSGGTTVTNQLFNGSGTTMLNRQVVPTKAERAQNLVDLIKDVIFPDVWKDRGGTATIRYFNGMLVVTAPRSVQEAIGGQFD